MKSESLPRVLGAALVAAVVFYFGAFHWIEARRHRLGPWEVEFAGDRPGPPTLIVNQPRLGITNVQLAFVEAPPLPPGQSLRRTFAKPGAVPETISFARLIFADLTFLPGTVTFEVFGHEIELLPRVLIVDKQEYPWRTGMLLDVKGPGRPASQGEPQRHRR